MNVFALNTQPLNASPWVYMTDTVSLVLGASAVIGTQSILPSSVAQMTLGAAGAPFPALPMADVASLQLGADDAIKSAIPLSDLASLLLGAHFGIADPMPLRQHPGECHPSCRVVVPGIDTTVRVPPADNQIVVPRTNNRILAEPLMDTV